MLRHAIAPERRFTKVSHDLVRHRRLGSDAKLLVIYVHGLPEAEAAKPLGDHAEALGMRPRAFQRAKEELVMCGFFHQWRSQRERGRWVTDQLLSNLPLTGEQATRLWDGQEPPAPPVPPERPAPPTVPERAVGEPEPPVVGPSPVEEDLGKNTPHPPPEVAAAESVLLSLRHSDRSLWLGAREVRGLVDAAAEWLRRGFSTAELHHALTAGLPPGGVRSAVGFLRHRLAEKLPLPVVEAPPPAVRELVPCAGPGDEHVFRPVGDETHCGPCRQAAAYARYAPRPAAERQPASWRTRLQDAAGPG
ncbi:hypothetical protein [Streptomyces sp. NPDC015131]|uniref:hypothetical protein n=1 Tax=Streptomyces sp. NPDC015131 TaxID=3364941 RepID=UPI0036FB27D7